MRGFEYRVSRVCCASVKRIFVYTMLQMHVFMLLRRTSKTLHASSMSGRRAQCSPAGTKCMGRAHRLACNSAQNNAIRHHRSWSKSQVWY